MRKPLKVKDVLKELRELPEDSSVWVYHKYGEHIDRDKGITLREGRAYFCETMGKSVSLIISNY